MYYDYLLVGAGLFNATIAHKAAQAGKRCLVIDKRSHIGGNIHTQEAAVPGGGQGRLQGGLQRARAVCEWAA